MKTKTIFTIVSTLLLFSCGPKLEEKPRSETGLPNGQKFRDSLITSYADETFVKENIVDRTSVQDSLKQIEMMFAIKDLQPTAEWSKRIERQYQDLEKKTAKNKFSYSNSVYLDLVYDQIIDEVSSTVKSTDKKITADTKKVVALIRKIQKESLQLSPESSLKEKLVATQNFLNSLTSEIKKMNIISDFKDSFVAELKQQGKNLLSAALQLDDDLVRSESLDSSLKIITGFIEKTATQINAEDQANLKFGQQLADTLAAMKDAPTGLQALALVWTLLNDQQKIQYFKQANEDLYKFLAKKSPEDIQCMCEKNCKGFKTKIILNLGVYPAIEKFGLQNIVDLINQKSLNFINLKVNQVAFDTLAKIGEEITERVLATVTQKRNDLGQFKDNLRSHLSKGLEQEFSNQKVKPPSVFLVDKQNLLLDLDTQSSYLRNKVKSLAFVTDQSKFVQTQFEVVEGFLNLPLFSQSPETNEKTLQSDLIELLLKPQPRQFLKSLSNNKSEVNLKQQSELLLTASTLLDQLADWKTSSFDNALSTIKADRIIRQFKSKDLDRSFFPKTDLTAVVLSISSQVLSLMQSTNSMLVLVDNQNQILPVQKISDQGAGPIALAAATDFKNGLRIPIAKTSDLGEFLSSMDAFYHSTEEIEKTKSTFLLQKNENGKSLLEEAVAAREDIKLLMIAIANFISNQLIQPNGLVSKSIALNENLKPLDKYELLDQTRAIDALMKAYDLTKIDVYLWTAKNIYYSMNRLLYSDKIKFYQQSTENEVQTGIDKTKLLETYKNLIPLKSYLSPEEQAQFERIFEAWLKA